MKRPIEGPQKRPAEASKKGGPVVKKSWQEGPVEKEFGKGGAYVEKNAISEKGAIPSKKVDATSWREVVRP